ncbi:MAG: DNA-protecting protein DprA [Alphaproteobacteria bacterium]|nr:DNA-protecting protein DprA [Alphaproteobacteria bacterium]
MRVDGFWLGLARLGRQGVDVWRLAQRAGGWAELRAGGAWLWRELGLDAVQRCVLDTAPHVDTFGVAVTADDAAYPSLLAGVPGAPPVLFVEGDLQALHTPGVAVVGTRNCTRYGASIAHDLGAGLAAGGVCVVSGLARGIDAAAHRGALSRGRTVAVLAHGLGHTAPANHVVLRQQILAAGGAMVTEWPDDMGPRPHLFPPRNRWIAGLAHCTVLVEAPVKSGAMHTVHATQELERPIHVVPGQVGNAACAGSNRVLRDEAFALLDVDVFVDDMCGSLRHRDGWLSALFAGATLDEVAKLRGGSVAELIDELQTMEALGRVVRLPGRRYASA